MAALAFPKDFDPGLAHYAVAGQLAQLEYTTENASSESGRCHGRHLHAQRAAHRTDAGRSGSAAGIVIGVAEARIQPSVWDGICGRLIEQEVIVPRVHRSATSRDGGLRLNSIASDAAPEPPSDPLPASAMDAAGLGQQPVRRASPQGRRLCLSLLLSLLVHALLLSLTFSGQEFGLPGFALPWQDRRIEVPDLRVVLAPAPVTNPKPAIRSDPLPLPPVLTEQTVAAGPAVVTFKSPGRRPARPAPATVPRSTPKAKASPRPKAATSKAPARCVPEHAQGEG